MFACVVSLFWNAIVIVVLLFMPTPETFSFVAFTAVSFQLFPNIFVNDSPGFVELKLQSSAVFMLACVVSLFWNVIFIVVLLFMKTPETFSFVTFTPVSFQLFPNIFVNDSPGFGASYFSLLPNASVEGLEFPKDLLNFFVVPFESFCLPGGS